MIVTLFTLSMQRNANEYCQELAISSFMLVCIVICGDFLMQATGAN